MRPEDAIQKSICQFLTLCERQGRLLYFAVPNAGKRGPRAYGHLRATGMRAGVPDLVLLFPRSRTAFIEVKAGKGSVTDNQAEWFGMLTQLGFPFFVARSVNDVEGIVKAMETEQ